MIADNLKLKGRLNVVVTSPDGEIKEEQEIDNLVVTTGKNFVASRMAGTSAAVMSHMAIGTGTTAAAAGDTGLGSEAARAALTSTTVNNNDVVYAATFSPGTPSSTTAVTELVCSTQAALERCSVALCSTWSTSRAQTPSALAGLSRLVKQHGN